MGFVSVWDIEHYLIDNSPVHARKYCISLDKLVHNLLHCLCVQASFRNPSNIRSWRAHAGVVTDLKYASHDFCPLLISMSDDCTARLWNMNGHFVGTFGQVRGWVQQRWLEVLVCGNMNVIGNCLECKRTVDLSAPNVRL